MGWPKIPIQADLKYIFRVGLILNDFRLAWDPITDKMAKVISGWPGMEL